MTQAYNLAILANAVDSSGKLNVATNSTGVLPVANGGTGLSSTPSNGQLNIGNGSGFTRATITAGSGISVTNGSGSITIAASGAGTVTSVATGNGLSGGTITSTGTLIIAAPSYNSVGSYAWIYRDSGGISFNTTFSAGASAASGAFSYDTESNRYGRGNQVGASISGTWRAMSGADAAYCPFLCVRVS